MNIKEHTKPYFFNEIKIKKAMNQAFNQNDYHEFSKNIKELSKNKQ